MNSNSNIGAKIFGTIFVLIFNINIFNISSIPLMFIKKQNKAMKKLQIKLI